MLEVLNLYFKILDFVFSWSWIWLPFFLAVIFFESWMYYIQRFHWRQLDWVMLEVKPPKETESSPKNMEQIFAGLWGTYGTISNKYEKYIKGVLQDYFSFEIAGLNGEIHFYLRTIRKFRNLVEAHVYSQYPQAEIKEVEDYVNKLPADVPGRHWNLWGCRLKLVQDEVYPLRTYPPLIDVAKTDQPFFDPLAGLMELMGKLRPGEQIWVQIVFRATDDRWRAKSIQLASKLLGKKLPPPLEGAIKMEVRTWWEALYDTLYSLITDLKAPLRAKDAPTNEPPSLAMHLSPGEKEIIAGIEEKAGKKGFEAKIQWAYIARNELFSPGYIGSTMGIFHQFANINMNSFRPDTPTMTKANYILAKTRKAFKQRVLMRMMRLRPFWEKGYILNIEELATLFHFPTISVKSPMTPYIEVKKGGPPADLPIE